MNLMVFWTPASRSNHPGSEVTYLRISTYVAEERTESIYGSSFVLSERHCWFKSGEFNGEVVEVEREGLYD